MGTPTCSLLAHAQKQEQNYEQQRHKVQPAAACSGSGSALLVPVRQLHQHYVARGEGPSGGESFAGGVAVRFEGPPPLSGLGARGAKDTAEEGALARKNQPAVAWRTARGKVRWRGRPWALGGADG